MSWVMTLFVYVILLCASTIHQVTGGKKTNVPTRADDNCVCYDVHGKAVNPTSLQSKDGSPRYLQHILASRDLPFTCTFANFTQSLVLKHHTGITKPRSNPIEVQTQTQIVLIASIAARFILQFISTVMYDLFHIHHLVRRNCLFSLRCPTGHQTAI